MASSTPIDLWTQAAPFGAALAAGALVLWSLRRRAASVPSPKPPVAADRSAARDRIEVEMHDLARSLSAELDTRIAVLGGLIRTAEARIAKLEALAGERPRPEGLKCP